MAHGTNPTTIRTPHPASAADLALSARLIALTVFAPTLALLLIAARLAPNANGIGTHTQLGLTPCGFEAATALPCATCGMTTAFAHAANGQLLRSFVTQPAGMVLAVLTAMAVLVSGWALIRGVSLLPWVQSMWRPRVVVTLIALLLGAWMYTAGRAMLAG